MSRRAPFRFLEFFAGGGMARLGLGPAWACVFANDVDPLKAATYRANFGSGHLVEGDVWGLDPSALPGGADLAWASSPCQDLSLAGPRAGLSGARSSAFWGFWRLVAALDAQGRAPGIVVLENVAGLLSSNGGADLEAIGHAFAARGYRFGALEIDAAAFLPQSRPRAFVVAARGPVGGLAGDEPSPFASGAVVRAVERLPARLQQRWVWWRLAAPPPHNAPLVNLLEPDEAVRWRSEAQTAALLAQMAPLHRRRLAEAAGKDARVVAAVYRRVRVEHGRRIQRAELRVDGLAGCLRTPGGGSSRQLVLVAQGGRTRSRWLTPREGARLMGMPESYRLPAGDTAAWRVIGDGVVAPVVRHLAEHLLEPLAAAIAEAEAAKTISGRTRLGVGA
ncbi:MAG TPA: DNA cytosine methyltransferase [Caulobacteraceae bacterium]|nr:DNA cytosine methyltransferase [Caulobacteraceae bacterium]